MHSDVADLDGSRRALADHVAVFRAMAVLRMVLFQPSLSQIQLTHAQMICGCDRLKAWPWMRHSPVHSARSPAH